MDLSRVSIGLAGATPHGVLEAIAPQIEAAGFRGLWLNDTPDGDSLAGLAVVAGVTSTLRLGTGVIPLDRRPAAAILASLDGLPLDRLTIGVGSGAARHSLGLMEHSVAELRAATTARLAIGALGPRMRELAARASDAVILNWLTPEAAAAQRSSLVEPVDTILYARTALTPDALPALRAEADRYGSYPAYAANFARIGAEPLDTTITSAQRIRPYLDSVDELVLRVVARESTLAEYERFLTTLI